MGYSIFISNEVVEIASPSDIITPVVGGVLVIVPAVVEFKKYKLFG